MARFLDKLREKPIQTRKRIALLSTSGVFAVVVMVWWVTWTSPITESTVATKEAVSPFGILAGAAAATKDGLRDLPGKLLEQAQYTATGSDPYGRGSVKQSDIVYPDQLSAPSATMSPSSVSE